MNMAQRVTGIVATIVVLIVAIGTILIVSPPGTPLRSEVRAVALPYFGQTWKIFAPSVMKANRSLEFRASWRDDDGDLVKSGWVSITQIEQRTVEGNPFPSRIQKPAWNAAGTFLERYNKLDADQRTRVRDTFIEVDGDDFRPIPTETLVEELGKDDGDVIRYLRMDYMMMRMATLFGTAGFNEKIERVQWRIVSERPNDFTHRFDEEAQFTPSITTFGWRESNVVTAPDVVADYRALIERTGATFEFKEAIREAE
ncbi:DUF5819 family protein [Microbacterium sp. A93]|uniref:DUF5819 family protein n=1 Tax=unclassified Microbacterium TaxID=2609290 RepID=UPI003F43EAAD